MNILEDKKTDTYIMAYLSNTDPGLLRFPREVTEGARPYSAIPYSAIPYSAIPYSAIPDSVVRKNIYKCIECGALLIPDPWFFGIHKYKNRSAELVLRKGNIWDSNWCCPKCENIETISEISVAAYKNRWVYNSLVYRKVFLVSKEGKEDKELTDNFICIMRCMPFIKSSSARCIKKLAHMCGRENPTIKDPTEIRVYRDIEIGHNDNKITIGRTTAITTILPSHSERSKIEETIYLFAEALKECNHIMYNEDNKNTKDTRCYTNIYKDV